MAIIYSYPETTQILLTDMLIGTSTIRVAGKKKNLTKNFTIETLGGFIHDNFPTQWGEITGTLSNQIDLQAALDSKQSNITLTTIGTSGPSTFIDSILNIPNYTGGIPTKTSDLINDGEDGIHPFITVEDIPPSASTLNDVLTNGNTSLLDAKIGELYLYDTSNQDYGKIQLSDSEYNLYNSSGSIISTISNVGAIFRTNAYYGFLNIPGTITANRTYEFPNASGTIALTSDLPTVGTWGALNYPAWTTGTPFVKMTALGTFALDTNTYLTGITYSDVTTALGYTPVTNARTLTINGIGYDLTADRSWTIPTNSGTVTSVGLTMPVAFSVSNSPITGAGDITVTAAGTSAQYIRGDGQLATFPTSGGGGSSVAYYLNGSIPSSVVGYKQMDNDAVVGIGTDFSLTGNGLIAQFLTDIGNPNRIEIPGGAWNFEMYFNISSVGGNTKFYVDLLKYDGSTFTLISSGSTNPEEITGGTSVDLYLTSLAVPTTPLLITDRLAIRVYIVDNSGGRTATLHTEDNNLCEIITTFSSGVASLNGLTANTQYLAVGTTGSDFNISSLSETHIFNLPTASATNRGALSSTDWSIFNGKQNALTNPITGTGTLNYIPKFTAGSTLANSTIIQLANGDVTINGIRAGLGLASVAQNTVFGYQSGNAITTGNYNTLMGYQAGTLLTTGAENTFLGRYAGTAATTASANIAIGQAAGYNLTIGAGNNVLVGVGSGYLITTATYNTGVGNASLRLNITGNQNSAFGNNALYSNLTSYNTGIGYNSGYSTTSGNQNVYLGYESGSNNTTGGGNVAIGSSAGRLLSAGGNLTITNASIFIGYLTKSLANNQTNEIVIGDSAIGLGSNSVVLGNNSITKTILKGSIGIGTTAPVAKLHVAAAGALSTDIAFKVRNSADTSDLITISGTQTTIGATGIAVGNTALSVRGNIVANSTASAYVTMGTNASNYGIVEGFGNGLWLRTTGSFGAANGKIYINPQTNSNIDNYVSGTGVQIWTTSDTERMRLNAAGNLGIGTSAPVASAKVQIDSTTQGFLPPRMTNAQRIAIATPAVGLCVYCTDAVEGLYINKSTGWTYIG